MRKIATITSKRQITIPAAIFRRAGFSDRQKLLVIEASGKIILSPASGLINELAGSLKMPAKWRGKTPEEIIDESKEKYFKHKDNK